MQSVLTQIYSYMPLQGPYWAHIVEIESLDRPLEYYYCPPGYCRCTMLDGYSEIFCNNVFYHYDDDYQYICDRQGQKTIK